MAKKTTKKENQFNMQVSDDIGTPDGVVLSDLMADIEQSEEFAASPADEIFESHLQAAVAEVEAEVEEAAPVVAKKAKVEKPKEDKPPRISYVGNKVSDVLANRLGGDIQSNVLLEVSDAALDVSALAEKQAALMAMLNQAPNASLDKTIPTTQKKVAHKAVQLFTWIKENGKLNEVMRRAFVVLARDGELTSGEKGNLHAELLAKPYDVSTCRAQSGQIFSLFPMLKIVTKADKGRYVLNPDSLIFAKAKAELAL